ncbi:MAG: hypothetical protein SVU32_07120, partial [Candidatus Nanohaloarchaea archaeon]|nr:hypothetical protein [Candidatus Nanohaloarchaea archaeon]
MSGTDCDYCDDSFGSKQERIQHVLDEHDDELSSHDRDDLKRELNRLATDEGSSRNYGRLAIYLVGALIVVGAVYGIVSSGVVSFSTDAGTGPSTAAPASSIPQTQASVGPAGSVHEHATFIVKIAGQRVNFARQKYQLQSQKVHFEGGDGTTIHKHATGVNIGYALNTLNMGLNRTCLFKGSKRYCEGSGSLKVTVNGDAVDPPTPEDI